MCLWNKWRQRFFERILTVIAAILAGIATLVMGLIKQKKYVIVFYKTRKII